MGQHTFVSVRVHFTFGVASREHAIKPEIQERFWAYIGGIAKNIGLFLYAVGGFDDHVHVFIGLPATMTIAEVAQKLKANASRWMREGGDAPNFQWQDGYGAFSVSVSHTDATIAYINGQAEHHKRQGYAEELAKILQRHRIANLSS
jgi:putative transposase